jgi:glycosyltransferase involved in cell wall biosynthesis
MLQQLLIWSVLVAALCLTGGVVAVAVIALRSGGRRQYRADDRDALVTSRFTIPVSLIVPVDRDSSSIDDTIARLLGLHYSDFEVILVADERASDTLLRLKEEWELSAHEFFYRQSVATAAVRRMYRSGRDGRLTVAEKSDAGRADALNCGFNLARFRYAGVVDPGIVFEDDALLRAMAAPVNEPSQVIAASSHVEVRPGATAPGITVAWQQLESIRSFLDSRLAWRQLPHGLGPDEAVVVWQRDAVLKAGGFSTDAADPGLEMMVRLQARSGEETVIRTTEIFGYVDARSARERLRSISRQQRAVVEAVRAGSGCEGGFRQAIRYLAASRILPPFLAVWVIVGLAAGAAMDWLPWRDVALGAFLMSMAHALVTSCALLIRGSAAGTPDVARLRRLIMFSPLELVVFGPAATCARIAGMWQGLRAPATKPFTSSVDM